LEFAGRLQTTQIDSDMRLPGDGPNLMKFNCCCWCGIEAVGNFLAGFIVGIRMGVLATVKAISGTGKRLVPSAR